MAASASWLREHPDGVRVALKVTPRAGRDEVRGVAVDGSGRSHLLVRVTAPPDAGRANAAVVELLARRWRVPRRALHLISGASARHKVVQLDGPGADLAARLQDIEARATKE